MAPRRVVAAIDQLPGWQFVATALLLLATIKATWMWAQLARNPGATELGGMLLLAGSIVVSIFAIRRRQTGVWDAAAQVIVAIAGANLVSYALLIPVLPAGSTGEVARLIRGASGETLIGVGLAIPVQAAGLWLSRRFGTHSAVTERRGADRPEELPAPPAPSAPSATPAPLASPSSPVSPPDA